jgi:hypothetical protein
MKYLLILQGMPRRSAVASGNLASSFTRNTTGGTLGAAC